ncbi:gamma-butyrobetaine hydroxylase-like domain-containing protein [Neisseriaceae bacterium CLB008]|nr:DUF971 domain-containing protein [Neisseriaceae bacterium]
MSLKVPQEVRLNPEKNTLTLVYEGQAYGLPAEYLRVYSPSAEVRGHGIGQETLQVGKRKVLILGLETMGNYALKITYSDGHDSGLYDWNYLYDLALNQADHWQNYLDRLSAAGASRDVVVH